MSSKLTVKQSRKERPRSSDKLGKGKNKRETGTPEKASTPSQDALLEEGELDKKPVIINDEILALQIKPENLEKLRESQTLEQPTRTPLKQQVVVRKLKPASEWDKPVPKMVTVAKPAPPDAKLKAVDYSDIAGLRFDADGNVIPHSILGSVRDYKKSATQELGQLPKVLRHTPADGGELLSVKYEKKKKLSQFPKFESVEESNALKNWQKRMLERRQQQNHLSKMLNKAPDQLVMNQADTYRKTQELRYIIDRTIPTMDYGKGYRIGSEFWKQQERIGDDMTGIHMTLSQTEKGYPPPIQHVGVPPAVLQEKGILWDRPRTPFHKPWHKTPYLSQRQNQLQPVMNELDPHQPDLLSLEILGSNQSEDLDQMEEMRQTPDYSEKREAFLEREHMKENDSEIHPTVFGPSLKFAGQDAQWTGDSTSFSSQTGLEARVSFEAYAGDRVTSFLEIVNNGTTCVYFKWKKVPKVDPFEMMAGKVQRFYFNTSSGVILPGDTMKFPFIFKSSNAGVFSEQWCFKTTPVVCGGAALVVTLRGVALQKDTFKKQRGELEQELAHRQAEQIIGGVLDGILDGIRTPDRPSTPVDHYITEHEVFSRKNPGLHYSWTTVENMRALHKELHPEEEEKEEEKEEENEEPKEPVEWDLSVQDLTEQIMCLDEEDEHKQELLQRLNSSIISLSFPPYSPKQQQMYTIGYNLLCELVDSLVIESIGIRSSMGLPEREQDDFPEDIRTSKTGEGKKKPVKDTKTDKDKKIPAKDSKATPKPGSKEAASRGGKVSTPGSKRQSANKDKDRPASSQSQPQTPVTSEESIIDVKYKEKLYSQASLLFEDMADNMAIVFEEISNQDEGCQLPHLS